MKFFNRLGLWKAEEPETTIIVNTEGVSIESVPEEPPQFKRKYEVRLDNRAVLTITIRTLFGRSSWGVLTQPDDRWITFDPEKVADKIIDPLLVPLVEARSAQILALDRDYMKSNPSEFKDTQGNTWVRKNNLVKGLT